MDREIKDRIQTAKLVADSRANYFEILTRIIEKLEDDRVSAMENHEKYKDSIASLAWEYSAEALAELRLISDLTNLLERELG